MRILSIILLIAGCFGTVHAQQVKSPSAAKTATTRSATILPGAAQLNAYLPLLKEKRVAIFANQTSLIGKTHLVDSLQQLGVDIRVIFGPEHGFRGNADAGEKVSNYIDEKTGIPVVSLYGQKRRPDEKDLSEIDVMIFDIQDVGVRFYTYISSLETYIQSALEFNKPLIILDRPNPNGFYVDGPVLDLQYRSFIGMQPIPIVYGLTIGEYAKMLVGENWIQKNNSLKKEEPKEDVTQPDAVAIEAVAMPATAPHALRSNRADGKEQVIKSCDDESFNIAMIERGGFSLIVICCKNYTHHSLYEPPVKPSPNIPDLQTMYLYPSTCFFEGTALSEGRGTNKPFMLFGHPSLPKQLVKFSPQPNAGAKSSKHYGKVCYGWDISGTPQEVLAKTKGQIQLKWLLEAYRLFPEKDSFFLLPKSGDMKGSFFNKLAGNNDLWQQIRQGLSEEEIKKSWQPALREYKAIRRKYLLYPDFE
ncbi:MAG: exo-beta-N-acetylmuramidase NamZ domain-containing protein [Sphingomonadales bacterium]